MRRARLAPCWMWTGRGTATVPRSISSSTVRASHRTGPTAAGTSTSASTSPVTSEPANTPSRHRATPRAHRSRRRRWCRLRPRASSLGGHHRYPQTVRHRPQPEVGRRQLPVHDPLPLAHLVPGRALLDSTVDENYDEIRGWFRLAPRAEKAARGRSKAFRGIVLVGFLLVGGIAGAFLDPSVGPSITTVALAVGLATSLAVVFVCFGLPGIIYMRRSHQDRGQASSFGRGRSSCMPRLSPHLTGLAPGARLPVRSHRRARLRNGAEREVQRPLGHHDVVLHPGRRPRGLVPLGPGISRRRPRRRDVLARCRRRRVAGTLIAASRPSWHHSDEGTGRRTSWTWKFLDWAAVYVLGAYAYVSIVLRPASSSGGDNNGAPWKALLIASSFAAISIAFWAYFRLRPSPREARTHRGFVGDL